MAVKSIADRGYTIMKSLSNAASAIKPSATLAINALSQELKSQGVDVVSFGAGETDFFTPDPIKEAGIAAIQGNKSYYTSSSGVAPLKAAICGYLDRTFGVKYENKNICVTSGAKHVLYIAMRVMLNPGDEVILPAPYWVTYEEAIRMCGAKPVILKTDETTRFKVSPEQLAAAVTDRTKAVILTNPSNPTGMLYSEEELRALAKVIVENDLYLIDDEIYATLVYEGKFVSAAAIDPELYKRTVVVNGVSKTYAMTGWRIGFAAGPAEIIKLMDTYLSHSTGNACNIAQYAAIEAYSGDQTCVEEMRKKFAERREYFVSRVNAIDKVSCLPPDGAFYIFMNVSKTFGSTICGEEIRDSSDFAQALLKHGLVATVPGAAFGSNEHIRWSYATSLENIKKGLDRLEKFLNNEPLA